MHKSGTSGNQRNSRHKRFVRLREHKLFVVAIIVLYQLFFLQCVSMLLRFWHLMTRTLWFQWTHRYSLSTWRYYYYYYYDYLYHCCRCCNYFSKLFRIVNTLYAWQVSNVDWHNRTKKRSGSKTSITFEQKVSEIIAASVTPLILLFSSFPFVFVSFLFISLQPRHSLWMKTILQHHLQQLPKGH